jgi:hypothetical protein
MPMNDANAVEKMRELLREFGSWTAIHKASTLDKDGVLVVKRQVKAPQEYRGKVVLEKSD